MNALAIAFDNQTEIGWNNLLKGRIAVKWRHIMEEVYTGNARHLSGDRFQRHLIKGMWRIYNKLWKERCNMLHDPTDVTSLTNEELNDKLRMYYERPRHLLGAGDIHLLGDNITMAITKLIRQKRSLLLVLDQRAKIHSRTKEALLAKHRPINYYCSSSCG